MSFRSLSKDITGNLITSQNIGYSSDLDLGIMMIISAEEDASTSIRKAVSIDDSCGIGHILLALQYVRVRDLSHRTEDFVQCLSRLETLAKKGKLTYRETYFTAAVIAWAQGHLHRAAALFESSIMKTENDALALRLAQECYLAAGDVKNTLLCVTRTLQVYNDTHYLHGHYQAMLARGFLENNRFIDSEEVGNRAVSMTRGRDVFALETLLSTYQLAGRSSEVASLLDEYQSKHEGSKQDQLLFHQGLAMIQRGNYSGARGVLRDLVEEIGPTARRSPESVSLASILVWHLYLNMSQPISEELTTAVACLWIPFIQDSSNIYAKTGIWHDICAAMALGLAAYRRRDRDTDRVSVSSEEQSKTDGQVLGDDKAKEREREKEKVSEAESGWGTWMPSFGDGSSRSSVTTHPQEFVEPSDLLHTHMQRVKTRSESTTADYAADIQYDQICPSFRDINPSFRLSGQQQSTDFLRTSPEETRDKFHLSFEVCKALQDLLEGSPSRGGETLLISRDKYHYFGGGILQTDVLPQTLIECLIRSNQLEESRMLLSERTGITPNEAQSWRRLSHVFSRLGHTEAAESAEYTAWQLGIGQGGFGGPK
eukprot:CAMPEP_0182426890 /NCGR_PEP_ID=MMETSP1167-20130531/13405_1 /TAXON_ID=2988 /ORGANISM="Mallomonas Sp, Strain CCMP3275" /LENGTH=597 /DNA_ID=CAMNT_0024608633 /DNA_START=230 /DNA_END=2023 /DNA_ORIENTATION=+